MASDPSRRTLVQKLGIKAGFRLAILSAPANYDNTLGQLPEDAEAKHKLSGQLDFVQVFATDAKALQEEFQNIKPNLKENGILWISWPKVSSGLITSLNEKAVRELGLQNGLVDVKVCAVDDVWSGLKFVKRIKDRRV